MVSNDRPTSTVPTDFQINQEVNNQPCVVFYLQFAPAEDYKSLFNEIDISTIQFDLAL